MPTKIADRVKETTTTTGLGAYVMAGAVSGFRAFSSAFLSADEVGYCVEDGTDWEVGLGTLTSGTPWTLARTTVLSSSNAGAAVNWGAGVKNIFCTAPASLLGSGGAASFPFYKADGSSDVIAIPAGDFPFYRADGTLDTIGV